MALTPGFEPGPHWWEGSALTTVPPLLPKVVPGCSKLGWYYPLDNHPVDKYWENQYALFTGENFIPPPAI